MSRAPPPDATASSLHDAVAAVVPGDFGATVQLLGSPMWQALEANFWSASHPLPPNARQSLDIYLELAKKLWHRAGLGQSNPIALYKTTLLSSQAIETALRVLARIYAGCNLGYCAPPAGFWRAVYALTGYIISERFPDRVKRQPLINQVLQLWLMAWINPLSLAPGRLPVAVRLVGILSKTCSFTQISPTHAGSGLAAADLMGDVPPMPFARVPAMWEPAVPLYINAQDAAFTMRELTAPPSRNAPSDVYDSLLQSAQLVGLSTQEVQDFIRRAMREFGYSTARAIPRVGRMDQVRVAVGFIDCWSALQAQSKPTANPSTFSEHDAVVVNHSEGGFLLRFTPKQPLLSVGTLLCLRGNEAEPWTLVAVRWLEASDTIVVVGCEVLCNYADARIAQTSDSTQHLPIMSFLSNDNTFVLCPYDSTKANGVGQLRVEDQSWVITAATEIGEDWQRSVVLDMTENA